MKVGRAPALMDNIFLTMVAPDFAIVEWMNLFGYKEKEIKEAMVEVHARIERFHAEKKKKQ